MDLTVFNIQDPVLSSKVAEFADVMESTIDNNVNQAYTKEMFGESPEQYYETLNDLEFLLGMMIIVYLQMQEDLRYLGAYQSRQTYIDDFGLDSITDYFQCKNIDIERIYAIFEVADMGDYTGAGYDTVYDPDGGNTKIQTVQ